MQLIFNGVLSLVAAGALSYVVLNPKINEGGLTKLGMIAMVLSLIASAMYSFGDLSPVAAYNAALVLRGGIVLVCLGYWVKFKRHKRDGKPTDFGSLTER